MELEEKRVALKKGIFYGWWIVVAGSLAFTINAGLFFFGFGAFFLPLLEEFRTSRTAISGVMSLARLESGFFAPVEGFIVDKFGPRRMMLLGITVMGIGFFLLSRVSSLLQLYVVFVLFIALGSTLGTTTPSNVAVANWFRRKRGVAFGITNSGVGLGGIVLFVITWLIHEVGWRRASQFIGLGVLVVTIPIAMVMRHKPEPYGYLPDGETAPAKEKKEEKEDKEEAEFSARQALRTRTFWFMASANAIRMMITSAVAVHAMPFLVGAGFSEAMAALFVSLIAFLSITGRLGFGLMADRFSKRHMWALTFVGVGVGMLIFATTHSLWQGALFLALYAPAYGGMASTQHAMRAEYFGRRAFGTIFGWNAMVQMIGTIIGPILAGYMYDVTQSYRGTFVFFAIISIATALLVIQAKKPQVVPESAVPVSGK
ncbi:MAG: MFS transporter [Chloroflexi bacterium]|nr:MFS transporter [Chloroflexota bacterium]